MLPVLCATVSGADDLVEVRFWGREKRDFLRTMLPFKRGVASHDTLDDVITMMT